MQRVREAEQGQGSEPTPLCLMWLSVVPAGGELQSMLGRQRTRATRRRPDHPEHQADDPAWCEIAGRQTRRSIAYLLIALLAFLVIACWPWSFHVAADATVC